MGVSNAKLKWLDDENCMLTFVGDGYTYKMHVKLIDMHDGRNYRVLEGLTGDPTTQERELFYIDQGWVRKSQHESLLATQVANRIYNGSGTTTMRIDRVREIQRHNIEKEQADE